jgi:prepilin-type N-terminal cleavage/methylation domain-containing protein
MKTKTKNFGLTLLELLIAVAVLVILVSMVMLAASTSWKALSSGPTKAVLETLDSALQEYQDFTGHFPAEPNSIAALTSYSLPERHSAYLYWQLNLYPDSKKMLVNISDSFFKTIETTTYLEFVDQWGTPIDYRYISGLNNFPVITSAGPDKNFNTAGDNITNKK